MKREFSWDRFADAGNWSELTSADRQEWTNQIDDRWTMDSPSPQRGKTLLPLYLWRSLGSLGEGLRRFGRAVS